ncbi:hypothetical protein [Fibrobacter sp. UBA3718]|uniref:hypothetical protein n=1 Tax=Fibrobacter sp. UBA3718 TaxID=1946531 RepID=UPI0025BB8448|nr:hypothetical protein [Fibrobacter sp. UBA3718]
MMIPDWKLERYLTGDLPEGEMREIRELEKTDEKLAHRVKLLREDNVAILRKMPFERLAEKMDARDNGAERKDNVARFGFVKFAAAAALVLAVVSVALFSQREIGPATDGGALAMDVALADVPDDGTRIKGLDARMEVWKKTGDSAVQMSNLGEAREGDEIQLRYAVPEKCYGMLFSMDGNGTVTMHMADGSQAIALEPGKMTTLPFAYKLDNAPKFEKFFLLTSRAAFELDANNIDALLKSKDVRSVSITLRKVGE